MWQDLRLIRVRQRLPAAAVVDPAAGVRRELERSGLLTGLATGARLAVALGSRKVARTVEVAAAVIREARARGLDPFVVAAMGSHGGGTAAGQRAVLEALGLTEDALGCRIETSMQAREIGRTPEGLPVWSDAAAAAADAILLVARVKPHTAFAGTIGSGPLKMLAVGLGKRQGAETLHSWAIGHAGLEQAIVAAAGLLRQRLPVRGAVALVEGPRGELAALRALPAARWEREEPELLAEARRLRPGLPVDAADLLLLDRMGKDISGTGMDPWVVGRMMAPGEPEPAGPRITRIYVRSLSRPSRGNAHGVGLADLVHRRLAQAIDWDVTAANALAAAAPQKARLPLVFETDREAIAAGLRTAGVLEPGQARVLWARDTRDLEELRISPSLLETARERSALEVLGPPEPLDLDPRGDLPLS